VYTSASWFFGCRRAAFVGSCIHPLLVPRVRLVFPTPSQRRIIFSVQKTNSEKLSGVSTLLGSLEKKYLQVIFYNPNKYLLDSLIRTKYIWEHCTTLLYVIICSYHFLKYKMDISSAFISLRQYSRAHLQNFSKHYLYAHFDPLLENIFS